MRRQNQRFTRVFPWELNMQDVKTNVLYVFSHQITYSNASSEDHQNGSLDVWTAKSIVSWQRRQRKNIVLEQCFSFSFRMSRLGTASGRQNQRLTHVLPSELTIWDVKPTFYACFTIRTHHMRRQNQRFTRILPSELTIWDVNINVLHVFYHQKSQYEMSKSTFHTCFAIENDIWDVKINVLHVLYH